MIHLYVAWEVYIKKSVFTVYAKIHLVRSAAFAQASCIQESFMAQLQSIANFCMLMLALGTTVSAVVIPGNGVNGCPSDEDRQAARQLLQSITDQVVQNYSSNPNCGPGPWRQVFYFNVSSEDQSCPGDWNVPRTLSVRGCVGSGSSCRSAFSDTINNIAYNKVCGSVIGVAKGNPDAFFSRISGQSTIEHIYLDGVSVTHGASGSRTHIWSFGAGHPVTPLTNARCPCENNDRTIAPLPLYEVRENYFCATTYPGDRLWSGSGCHTASSCCSFHNPPYFSVQLSTPTTDQTELRICTDEFSNDEMVIVQFAEIHVQ